MTLMIKSRLRNEHSYVQWSVAILANTTLLSYGLQSGWISPMSRVLVGDASPLEAPLSATELAWTASAMSLAAVAGVPFYTYLGDACGRRPAIIAVAVPQALSWLIKLYTRSMTGLVLARICCGISAGGCFNLIPMYIKEISQDHIRGTLGSLMILMQNVGILAMYAMGSYLEYYTVMWIALAVPVLTTVLMLKAPESPAFLIKVGKTEYMILMNTLEDIKGISTELRGQSFGCVYPDIDNISCKTTSWFKKRAILSPTNEQVDKEAATTVALLRGLDVSDKEVQAEVSALNNDHQYYKTLPYISFVTIFRTRAWRRALLLSLAVITASALNGNYVLLTHAAAVLAASAAPAAPAPAPAPSPQLQAVSFPVVMVLGSVVSLLAVDRRGRKSILVSSYLVSAAALVCLASTQLVTARGLDTPAGLQWLPLTAMLLSLGAYAAGVCPVPYIVMSEMFHFQIRCRLLGVIVMYAWLMSSVQLIAFGSLTAPHVAFYAFAVVNATGALIALRLPETRGKTVAQIEAELCGTKCDA